MKRLFSLFAIVTMLFVTSCQYDDSALTDRVDNLENRVEVLETLCAQLNTNISSLQTIVSALQSKNFITSVEPILKDGKTTGWKISFTNGDPITIYNGADGVDGKTPVIGVKKASDDIYYWTIDGKWLYDTDGNKVQAQATDGADGADGVTPKFQINNKGYWEVSYDNGSTWTEIGKATGADGTSSDAIFSGVDEDDEYVYFTLADGSIITVPKQSSLSITFDEEDLAEVKVNSEVLIGYTVSSVTKSVDIEVTSSADLKAAVVANDATNLTGYIKVVTGSTIDEYSKVIVFVSNDEKVIMKSIVFEPQQGGSSANIQIINGATKSVSKDGGQVTLEFLAGIECEAVIPDAAKSWISVVDTRALQEHSITLEIKANTGATRSANVTVQSLDGKESVKYTITQPGTGSSEPSGDGPTPNQIWYTTSDGNAVEVKYKDAFGKANFVSNIYKDGKGVITFDGPVQYIGDYAFADCRNLKTITIPSNASHIGNYTFTDCKSLLECNMASIHKIGTHAFDGCSAMTHLSLPESLTEVGSAAFFSCSGLKSIYIPGSLKVISDQMFKNCSFVTEITISEGVEEIGQAAFNSCQTTEIKLPSTITTIKSGAFYKTSLTKITIPENVTTIENETFSQCKDLKVVNIGSKVASIGEEAFYGCRSLASITIPESVQSIGARAFHSCSVLTSFEGPYASQDKRCIVINNDLFAFAPANITEYTIPEGVIAIAPYVFCENLGMDSETEGLTALTIPDGVVSIGNYAFYQNTKIKNITLGASLAKIGTYAFDQCSNLTEITLPKKVTAINDFTFNKCSNLESVTIEGKLTSVGRCAFNECGKLTNIELPENVNLIGEEAFCKTGLTEITLPAKVNSIQSRAFAGSNNLSIIYCKPTTAPQLYSKTKNEGKLVGDVFADIAIGAIVYVPTGCKSKYIEFETFPDGSSNYWRDYQYMIQEEPSDEPEVTVENNKIFYTTTDGNVVDVSEINFGVNEVSNSYTDGKGVIEFDGDVTIIPKNTFAECANLATITLPNTVTSIERSAFSGCSNLTSITLSNTLESIGERCFSGCSSLTTINIPESVETIGQSVCEGCSSLSSFTGKFASADGACLVVDGKLIAYATDYNTVYTIPENVTIIGMNSFASNTVITEITIPSNVTEIETNAFIGCTNLSSIICKGTQPAKDNVAMFPNLPDNAQIIVPASAVHDYKENWSDYADYIVAQE